MPNDTYYIICPYYQKTSGRTVYCSSPFENVGFRKTFLSSAQQREHMQGLCSCFHYVDCPIATLNDALLVGRSRGEGKDFAL